ncbi:glutathione S-transferase family protein [Crenobacter sp. SG2303]|uniref:Glutathione S-transferase family protein n=1 Tax=Crenobacter oryzisoli TaxID=3056844 RepID=A0ABT7XL33_9NEIS|nr:MULTISPECIES: glutathione S-transferase family protein [unclassified Crenobacter]MDN0074493.1 glutathione S-transferase family protein [Crenobacter sp. SG2303]MDN0081250.1 glutathione S-transferase family protein [Crenobacter sp. SG2305]
MITLYGAALSPYYNKVKIALIEKGVNFQEVFTPPSQEAEVLAKSPMGRIPFVEINGAPLAESSVILEWLEDAYPTTALLPPTPLGRAHVRELVALFENDLFMPAFALSHHLMWGAPLSDEQRDDALVKMRRGLAALLTRARLSPWLAGDGFTLADVSAAAMLPGIAESTRQLFGTSLIDESAELTALHRALSERPSVTRCWADRAAAFERFWEWRKQQAAG